MWLVMNNAFLSIVDPGNQGPKGGDYLLVRARIKGDLERVFGDDIDVIKLRNRDYMFRAFIQRKRVAKVIAEQVLSIEYTNFKGSTAEGMRHDAYMSIWSVMNRLQGQLNGKTIQEFENSRRVTAGRRLIEDDL